MTEDGSCDGGEEPSDREATTDPSGRDVTADPSEQGATAEPAAVARSDPGPTLTLDAVLSVLANRRRRFVLYALADAAHGLAELATLVEEVATLEAAMEGAALRRERYLEVAVDCYHWHLPVLADVGVVDCDDRHGAVRYRDHRTLSTWLGRVRRDELAR